MPAVGKSCGTHIWICFALSRSYADRMKGTPEPRGRWTALSTGNVSKSNIGMVPWHYRDKLDGEVEELD